MKVKSLLENVGCACSKMGVAFWSWNSEISCISRMNWQNERIFCKLIEIQKSQKFIQYFWMGVVKNGRDP